MSQVDRETEQGEAILTAVQETASSRVADFVEKAQGQKKRQTTLLVGLYGVGKSTVLKPLGEQIVFVDAERLYLYQKRVEKNERRPIVVTTNPSNLDYTREEFKNASEVFLPGMALEETKGFIANTCGQVKCDFSADELAKYSLGIPFLIEQLNHEGINGDVAITMVASYLIKNFRRVTPSNLRGQAKPYLQVEIPDDVITEVDKVLTDSILRRDSGYANLFTVLAIQKELASKGIYEESPLFISPKSVELYDEASRAKGDNDIDIFIPGISQQDLDDFNKSLGIFGNSDYMNRMAMFRANHRKVNFYFRDTFGYVYKGENEDDEINDREEKFAIFYKMGKLGLKPGHTNTCLLVHAHDHWGLAGNPVAVGWAVESKLQQRGIPYVATNFAAGKAYAYDPEKRDLIILPKLYDFRRYDILDEL